jgi:glutathione S-transferase
VQVAELYPEANLWPSDPAARAACRSAACEMHAGFSSLRAHMPMNCTVVSREAGVKALAAPGVAKDIDRICELWGGLRARYGSSGPLLFGADFSVADVMFAPVCLRFKTFLPPLTVRNESPPPCPPAASLTGPTCFRVIRPLLKNMSARC